MSGEGFYGGMSVDIRTGLPEEKIKSQKEKLEEEKLESSISTGLDIAQKIESQTGKFFIDLVTDALERRIDELVAADLTASTLLSLLTLIGGQIKAGHASAMRLAQMRLRRDNKIPNLG